MANTWIIAVDPQIAALVEHGRAVGGSVTAVTVGGTPVAGVDKVIDVALPEGVPAEAAAPAVAAAVAAEDPRAPSRQMSRTRPLTASSAYGVFPSAPGTIGSGSGWRARRRRWTATSSSEAARHSAHPMSQEDATRGGSAMARAY